MLKQNGIMIENLSEQAFKPYGEILEATDHNLKYPYPDSSFHVLAGAESTGWRLAALKFRTRGLTVLQVHRTTMETFEPVSGVMVLCVNSQPFLDGLRAFLLDKPILLYKDVWHNILTLSAESIVKITENSEVDAEDRELGCEVLPQLVVGCS